ADLVRPARAAPTRPAVAAASIPDGELFQRLRALRRQLADTEGVPAYIVFSDAVLARMAATRPTHEAELLAVPGIGPTQLARHGAVFLRLLREALARAHLAAASALVELDDADRAGG